MGQVIFSLQTTSILPTDKLFSLADDRFFYSWDRSFSLADDKFLPVGQVFFTCGRQVFTRGTGDFHLWTTSFLLVGQLSVVSDDGLQTNLVCQI